MPWKNKLTQRIKAILTLDHAALDANAVALFSQAARIPDEGAPGNTWIKNFISCMNNVQSYSAKKAWLDAVESTVFSLDAADKAIQSLKTAVMVDARPKIINVRTLWTAFVSDAVVDYKWDISKWPDRTRWFYVIVNRAWGLQGKDAEHYKRYAEDLAEKNLWARDDLLEYCVLNFRSAQTVDTLFMGQATTSLAFVTAMSTIVLRMHQGIPTVEAAHLHQRAYNAWPDEMAQIEATIQAHTTLEGSCIEDTARKAQSMELGGKGYSAYYIIFGKDIHAYVNQGFRRAYDTIMLPAFE
jgi:hypothetical protein